jgi:hypothetical protein
MRHPFERIPAPGRTVLFWSLLGLAVASGAALIPLDERLRTAEAPNGMLSFEFAGSASEVRRILGSWDERARLDAAFSLGLDYLFLVGYSSFLALGCVMAAERLRARGSPGAGLGGLLAWGQWLAGLLDATENAALLTALRGAEEDIWPAIASRCAGVKFGLVGAGTVYGLMGLIAGAIGGGIEKPPSDDSISTGTSLSSRNSSTRRRTRSREIASDAPPRVNPTSSGISGPTSSPESRRTKMRPVLRHL